MACRAAPRRRRRAPRGRAAAATRARGRARTGSATDRVQHAVAVGAAERRRGGRRSPRAPARSRARATSAGSTPFSARAGAGSPGWLATWPRAWTPRVGAAGDGERDRLAAHGAERLLEHSCTVRRPGWRAQPAKSVPSYSSSSRAARALPALARDDHQVVGADPQRAVVRLVAARARARASRARICAKSSAESASRAAASVGARVRERATNSSGESAFQSSVRRSISTSSREAARTARARSPRRPTPRGSGGSGSGGGRSAGRAANSSPMTPSGDPGGHARPCRPGRTTRNSSRGHDLGRGAIIAPKTEPDAVEARVLEGQLLGVGLDPLDLVALGLGARAAPLDHRRATRSEATTLAPSRAQASAKLPSPAATSSTSWPAETAHASHSVGRRRRELAREDGVVPEPPGHAPGAA